MGGYSHKQKHLIFEKRPRLKGKKTDTWNVRNGEGHHLGIVVYRPGWRRYVFRWPAAWNPIDFDAKCLGEAIDFLDEQTAKLKATWKKRKAEGR